MAYLPVKNPMVKLSAILTATIVLLGIWYPFVDKQNSVYLKPVLAISIGILLLTAALLLFYKWIHVSAKKGITKELAAKYEGPEKTLIAPVDILYSMAIYNEIATKNYWMYRALGVIGLASSLFLAVSIQENPVIPVYATKMLAFISSLSTGIIFSFNLVEKSNRARKAFRHILNAVMLYEYGQIPLDELLKRYSESENYMGDDEYRQPTAGGGSSGSA